MLRFSDLLRFVGMALFQQRVRSLLTTLGVLFGTFVLVFSLSLKLGSEQALVGMWRRHQELRMIRVYPGSVTQDGAVPEGELVVRGEMGAAKKERIREALRRDWQVSHAARAGVRLTRERFEKLAGISHVESVLPVHYRSARVVLKQHAEQGRASALPADTSFDPMVVVGRPLTAADTRAVLVSEYLLYRLGVRDDADVQRTLGQRLRLEYGSSVNKPGLLMALLSGGAAVNLSAEGRRALEKTVSQLPNVLGKLDLTPAERASLKALFQAPRGGRHDAGVVAEDFTIAGVFRTAGQDEPVSLAGRLSEQADVLVSAGAGADLFFRLPEVGESGLHEAAVMVDSEQNLKGVLQEVRALGLRGDALLEHVEHDRAIFSVLFAVMNCVAAVAILVAGFGITNTMLMNVLERQREIGIMKAVGARERDVKKIFLVEGAVIGLVGSGLGLLLSFAASFPGDSWLRSMIRGQTPLPIQDPLFVFTPWLTLGIPPLIVLVTTLAAALPARRAVKLDPIVALRHE